MREEKKKKIQTLQAMKMVTEGMPRKNAAKLFGISEAQLGRDIKKYAEYWSTLPTFKKQLLKDKEGSKIYKEVMSFNPHNEFKNFLEKLCNYSPEVKVFTIPDEDADDEKEKSKRLEVFAEVAADHLALLLTKSKTVGLTWGGTIAALAKKIGPHRKQGGTLLFFPLCGEAPNSKNYALYSSSTLALRFHETFNSKMSRQPDVLSLASVPMMLPGQMTPEVREILEKTFLELSVAYERIYMHRDGKDEARLIDQVDTIISGVGSSNHPYGYINDNFLKSRSSLTKEEMATIIVGDIAGLLIPKPDISRSRAGDIEKLNEAIVGIKMEHIRNCAERARKTKKPGVILLAIGREKAPVVRYLIDEGMINHLLCDHALEEALIKMSS